MRDLVRVLLIIIGLALIVVGQLIATYLLPYPFSNLNVIFFALTLYLIFRESGIVVYLSLGVHFLVELYTVSPFGIVLYSATVSFLLGYWMYRSIFTNKSWFSALALSSLMLTMYRLLYILLGYIFELFSNQPVFLGINILRSFAYEIIITTFAITISVLVVNKISRRHNPLVVSNQLFKPR